MPSVVWGVYALDIWPTLFGAAVVSLSKLSFLDRMVWLYEEMNDRYVRPPSTPSQ